MIEVHRYISALKLADNLIELVKNDIELIKIVQKYVIPAINATPTEDVVFKRSGHWNLRIDKEEGLYLECSECGRHVPVSEDEAVEYLQLCESYPHCHCGGIFGVGFLWMVIGAVIGG